jgi:hypothetical protein
MVRARRDGTNHIKDPKETERLKKEAQKELKKPEDREKAHPVP